MRAAHIMKANRTQHHHVLRLCLLVSFGTALGPASCAPVQAPVTAPADKSPAPLNATAPGWRVGDLWRHAWKAGVETGIKTSEVLSVREVGDARYYVLRVETVNRYYTLDLRWVANVVQSRVAARAVPPQPWFIWPLEVGRQWEYQGLYEEQGRKDQVRESFRVLGVEEVEVPAGTFRAFKLVREGGAGSLDEYWYSPDVRWYVKWLGRRGLDEFQEVLQEYVRAPRAASSASSVDQPAGAGE